MRASTCQPGSGKKDLNRLPYLAKSLLRFGLNHEPELLRREGLLIQSVIGNIF